jgi:hypothetical protein
MRSLMEWMIAENQQGMRADILGDQQLIWVVPLPPLQNMLQETPRENKYKGFLFRIKLVMPIKQRLSFWSTPI